MAWFHWWDGTSGQLGLAKLTAFFFSIKLTSNHAFLLQHFATTSSHQPQKPSRGQTYRDTPQLGSQKGNVYFLKRKAIRQSPKWMKIQFSWGMEHWFMDRYYPLHRRFRPAHRKRMPVKLRGRHIDLLTGFRCWVRFIFREHLSFVNTLKTLSE